MILAQDEAKLYLQASVMETWAPRGQTLVVRADPQREHTSFYGAIDLKTGRVVVSQTERMNAETTAAYLQTLLETYPEQPLLLLWDRAPWHRGAAIRKLLAENPRLTLLEFPVASPDLNPQEHVWRAARRRVSHNHMQRRLPDLAARFTQFLRTTIFPCDFLDRFGWYLVCPGFT